MAGPADSPNPSASSPPGGEAQKLLSEVCAPLGLSPDATQLAKLVGYLDLLERWNGTYNLTAVRDRAGMFTLHLADCLAVVPALNRYLLEVASGSSAARDLPPQLLDVGSGGGLPGAVLAILLPQLKVTCVDAVGKKAAFVRQVCGALALSNLQAVHARVERASCGPFDVITSRAFASLSDFTALTAPLLKPAGVWLAMKGKVPHDELHALPIDRDVFHVEPLTVPNLQAERCLVWIRRRNPAASS